ncbi:mechanosensitive ion channel family protein [Halocola ammonii]
MTEEFWLELKSQLVDFIVKIGPSFVYALAGLIIGIFAIKLIVRVLKRALRKTNIELSLRSFIESLSVFLLYGLLFFILGTILGIKTTSFIAIFGAAGIAIGLALQGSLSNFAGGVLILAFKPFKVGDLIQVNNNLGHVQKIDILYTRIKTFDGRIITMPNGNVSNSDIDNRTMEPHRRIDLVLKFAFDADLDKLREIVTNALRQHPTVVEDLPVEFFLAELSEYDMKVKARCWVDSEVYWPVYWEQLEAVKKALDAHGVEIPIPRREIFKAPEKSNNNSSEDEL